jgi:1-acyl-sn-glycerol-3-phosphate acyltransferase
MKKSLLTSPRYWPIFWTQFWGALNDNVFKNAMVILITYRAYSIMGLGVDQMVALCGGIFIFPFFLFSSISGQYSDKLPKDKLVVFTKVLEVIVMGMGTIGFYTESLPLLFISLFLMGLQSTIFGPAKYSILPELIEENDLVKGNALVEMGTFMAILIGTILGGVLIAKPNGAFYVSATVLFFSVVGLLCSLKVAKLAPVEPTLKIDYNLFRSTWDVLKISKKTRSVFISILGISWFWFFGATLLSIFPVYVKDILHADESVVTLFLAIFSIGVAIGSIICERCSHERVELGLVPFGSIGLCWFALHLYLTGTPYEYSGELMGVTQFLGMPNIFWILFDLTGLSIMSGFFIVPLYTFIQVRSDRHERSRVIAANNILNALFMVAAAIFLMILFSFGLTSIDIYLVLFILNAAVAVYIYTVIPEFLMRFVCVILGRMIYRLKIVGRQHIPHEGAAILVCNHVTFVDWLILSATIHRPIRFVMHYSFMKNPLMAFFFRGAKVIPIAGAKEDPVLLEKAWEKISQVLSEGELLCIFPEGQITRDGLMTPFRAGVEKALAKNPVPVIPMAIKGMWGSFFSRKHGAAGTNYKVIPKRLWSKVELVVSEPWRPEEVTAEKLQIKVQELLGSDG